MTTEAIYRMCVCKVRHRSKRSARLALKYGGKRFAQCHVYYCPVCHGWHLGHRGY